MYTKEQLETAVSESTSVAQTLTLLGLAPKGGNYQIFKNKCILYNIDTSHFKGFAWNKGQTFKPKQELSEYLTNRKPIQSNKLRIRLLKEHIFEHECSCCKNSTWLGSPIPLELDHISGENEDNRLENLRLLCPNCHAQTPTYRGKNITK